MRRFGTMRLAAARTSVAPDGSDVRVLLGLKVGGMAHFELAPGETSTAVTHRSVEEIWMFVSGRGEMWRRQGTREETVPVEPGVCVTIPRGTRFQFRSSGPQALGAIAVTMPPWPGPDEAKVVRGKWEPSVPPMPSRACGDGRRNEAADG
jgi:mannose-6-phosphate isomerase-like protein (cupin superfamily)